MGEAAGAGAELAPEAASAAGAGKGAAPALGDAAAGATSGFGDAAGGAAGAAAGTSPFVLDSPIAAGSFDYLGAGTAGADVAGNVAPGAGFVTSDASLATGGTGAATDTFGAGSGPLAGANSAGQPFGAGGTTALGSSASIDPAAAAGTSPQLSAPSAGTGAGSIAPAAPSAAGTTPADATSSWGDMLKKGLTSNPLTAAISAAGLGYNILQGQKTTANQGALTQAAQTNAATAQDLSKAGQAQVTTNQNNAAPLLAQGEALTQPLTTGQLPAQYTQQIDQAINDAKTSAISNAAKNGQPTDPTKNTALAQQLAQIDNQRSAMTTQVANTLFGAGSGLINTATGVGNSSASSLLSGGQNAAGLSGQLYTTLTGIDQKQSEQTAKAIADLAKSLNSGGTPNTTQKAA